MPHFHTFDTAYTYQTKSNAPTDEFVFDLSNTKSGETDDGSDGYYDFAGLSPGGATHDHDDFNDFWGIHLDPSDPTGAKTPGGNGVLQGVEDFAQVTGADGGFF